MRQDCGVEPVETDVLMNHRHELIQDDRLLADFVADAEDLPTFSDRYIFHGFRFHFWSNGRASVMASQPP